MKRSTFIFTRPIGIRILSRVSSSFRRTRNARQSVRGKTVTWFSVVHLVSPSFFFLLDHPFLFLRRVDVPIRIMDERILG